MATPRPHLKKRCVDFVPLTLATTCRDHVPYSLSHSLLFSSHSFFSLYSLVSPSLIIPLLPDSSCCRMSWYSSRLTRQSSSSPMRHSLEYRSGPPTQATVSAQGAAAQAKIMLMLGPSWLPSSPPPRHHPPRRQRAPFPSLRWYSSRVRSSTSRGQRRSFPHTCTRPPLVSWRLAGTLRSQLGHDFHNPKATHRYFFRLGARYYLLDSALAIYAQGFLWSAPIH